MKKKKKIRGRSAGLLSNVTYFGWYVCLIENKENTIYLEG